MASIEDGFNLNLGLPSITNSLNSLDVAMKETSGHDDEVVPVPAPVLDREGIVTTDVTCKFLEACKAMPAGAVVKDGHFSLFSAVSALEIMDPKMDSGYLAPGESHDEPYDVHKPLSPEQVLGIIDQLLCHEMAWHLGYPLSQTIFTSVYIHSLTERPILTFEFDRFCRGLPPLLAALRAYCLALIKSSWWVNEKVRKESFYEEEDFVTHTYDRYMLHNIDDELIQRALRDARDGIRNMEPKLPPSVLQALELRLELRYDFLRSIGIGKALEAGESDASAMSTSSAPWVQMKAFLESIKTSHALGSPVPDAFSAKLQRHLASTVPPRPIVELSFEDAHQHFVRLVQDSIEALTLLDYSNTQCHLTFLQLFMASNPTPLVYVRGLVQSYPFRADVWPTGWDQTQLLYEDLSIIVLPASNLLDRSNEEVEATQDDRHFIARQMQDFSQRSWYGFAELHRAWCQNRPRARRMMTHILREWDVVQQDIEEIDANLIERLKEPALEHDDGTPPTWSLPLSSWAHHYKVRVMEWIVQLGFELEIYQPDEMAGMYHYLNVLSRARSNHLDRIKAFTIRDLTLRQKEFREGLPATVYNQFNRSFNWLTLASLDAAITWELSDALAVLYVVLRRLRLIAVPSRPHGSDKLRYELRMRPWSGVQFPPLPEYLDFTRDVERGWLTTELLLTHAEKAVGHAKKGFEVAIKLKPEERFDKGSEARWTKWYKDGQRAAIFAGIAIATVKGAYGKAAERRRQMAKSSTNTESAATAGKTREAASQSSSANAAVGMPESEWALTMEELGIKVEIPPSEKAYHPWWIVPKLSTIKREERK